MLPRSAKLEVISNSPQKIPPEQNVPLSIPKMPKSFLDQIKREQSFGPQVYRAYRYEFLKLKIATYKAFLSLVHTGELLETQTTSHSTVSIVSTELKGLGPRFHLIVNLIAKKEPAVGLPILIEYDLSQFSCKYPYQIAPVLLPGRETSILFILDEIEKTTSARTSTNVEPIVIFVLSSDPAVTTPLLVTSVNMTLSTPSSSLSVVADKTAHSSTSVSLPSADSDSCRIERGAV